MSPLEAYRTNPWVVCILPLAIFMAVTAVEPKAPAAGLELTPAAPGWLDVPYDWYPILYTAKVALTGVALWFVSPGLRQFPLRVSPLAWLVGLVGAAVWVGLCELDLERTWFPRLGLAWLVEAGQRSGFNPLVELADRPIWAYGFLAVRFVGLAAIVPVVEELFLRGFVTRFVDNPDWPSLPIGQFSWTSAVGTTAIAMLAHPAELLAAAVWFSLVSVMVRRTGNLWDAVAAHAVTNLLLGLYVVQSGAWRLL